MRRVSSRLALFAVLAASVLGISAIGATAKTSPTPTKHKSKLVLVTGGSTTITVTQATATFLVSHGITPSPIAPATLSGTSLTLPVKVGVAKVTKQINGAILHTGGVKFSTASKSLTVRHITFVKTGKAARVDGTVHGKLVRLATVRKLKVTPSGKTATVTGELHLTAQVAHIINKLVGKHIVSAGFDFGSFTSQLTLK